MQILRIVIDSDGTFSHNFDSINDHQHRAFQIYYKADNDIIIDAFKVSFLTNGAYGNRMIFINKCSNIIRW